MPNSDPEGRIFLSAPNSHDRFFFLHTFLSPAFYFNVGVAINESRTYTLMFTILKVDIICDVALTSTPNVLTTELPDLLCNQCIDNTCCYSFFIYRTGQIRVCKIRFVRTGENCGKPCLVCKKKHSFPCFNVCQSQSMIMCCSPKREAVRVLTITRGLGQTLKLRKRMLYRHC